MPDLHKTLIVAHPQQLGPDQYTIDELAIATEHAPFRHKKAVVDVGGQRKKKLKIRSNTDSREIDTSNFDLNPDEKNA
jgi:hypothetical protein